MSIPEDHSGLEILPARAIDMHYNVKTLLENNPCDNCLWISDFTNNADGTISVEISIRHPYPFQKYFTGFDVRGIVYTQADYYFDDSSTSRHFPALVKGDIELLNPDGYTNAYTPFNPNPQNYPPIYKYQPGGDLGGTFDSDDQEGDTAYNLFGLICYYSSEVRRHFATDAIVSRTYNFAVPAGPWEFGYAVDACWAPPLNVPVKDIKNDFPKAANTLLNYDLKVSVAGPLVGSGPVTMTIRAYSHFQDILEIYSTPFIRITDFQLTGMGSNGPKTGPVIVDNQYVEFTYDLVNALNKPPGKYPILITCTTSHPYLGEIEPKWWLNSLFSQILWVTVE